MRAAAIIQARMGSTRLPDKVLQDIAGTTMLGRVVGRVRQSRVPDLIVVATTTAPEDAAIVDECRRLGVTAFRGSEPDVLDRYYRAAVTLKAEIVARITSDCPLLDPEILDLVLAALREGDCDYASNTVERTFPLGLDAEAMTFSSLRSAWEAAKQPYERAHVTAYIWQHPERFRIRQVKAERDFSRHRWTVDTPDDLAFVRAVYNRLDNPEDFRWRDVLRLVTADPGLEALNRHVRQKDLMEG